MKTFVICNLLSALCIAQKLHTPSEILSIMEKSPVAYTLQELKQPIPCHDYSSSLNDIHIYVVNKDSQNIAKEYSFTSQTKALYKRAESFFGEAKYDSARACYERLLKADSTLFFVYTMLGQIEEIKGNSDRSIEFFKKAISKNFYDYMAHWFLADHLVANGNFKEALNEIVLARILNRNSLRVKTSFEKILRAQKLSADDICFTPQYEVDKPAEAVIIKTQTLWMGYGMVKAVWAFEPGYKTSMGVEENSYSSLEEREALISLYVTTSRDKRAQKYPELVMFNKAVDKQMLDEFLFFEIILREHPNIVYTLKPEFIQSVKKYVIEVRQGS
jgi:tetratricopeptide (TPR) repeat protein